jgi:hypothetical protein
VILVKKIIPVTISEKYLLSLMIAIPIPFGGCNGH